MKNLTPEVIAVIGIFVAPFASAQVDQKKFEPVYRAAKAVEASANIGMDNHKFNDLLQTFATEASIAQDRADTANEREVVAEFKRVLEIYTDSKTLWDKKIKQEQEQATEAGYIRWTWHRHHPPYSKDATDTDASTKALVEKYDLPSFHRVQHHRSPWSRKETEQIDFESDDLPADDTIKLVWERASAALAVANATYYGRPVPPPQGPSGR